jgi:hypothetical protein
MSHALGSTYTWVPAAVAITGISSTNHTDKICYNGLQRPKLDVRAQGEQQEYCAEWSEMMYMTY